MNENRYHYHFTTFDLEIYNLEDFMYNDVNITTYRLVDYGNPLVRNMIKEIDKYHPMVAKQLLHRGQLIKASSAIMYDSVYAFARGLHQFHKNPSNQKQSPLPPLSSSSSSSSSTSQQMLSSGASSSSSSSSFETRFMSNPPYYYDTFPIPVNGIDYNSLISPIFGFGIFGNNGNNNNNNGQLSNYGSNFGWNSLNTYASCTNETPWMHGLSLYNYIDSVRNCFNYFVLLI